MSSGDASEPSPVKPLRAMGRRARKPRAVVSELYRKRVVRMFGLYCETMDKEMYWRPETWTPEFSRRFVRVVSRFGSLKAGERTPS